MANYVADLQPELEVNYCRLVVVWTDDPASTRAARQKLGATFPFLCDHDLPLMVAEEGERSA